VTAVRRRLDRARILMYSHDTFGLGHLRRCRAIAHSLVEHFKGLSVLIVSGSPIAGAFDYRARVDFVKIPSVIKLYNGDYTSMDRHIKLRDTLAMREAIIRHTAESYQPDLMIVDKEPLGLRGELEGTLSYLKARGSTLVLGLRDVMDSPGALRQEWSRRGIVPKVEGLFDSVWVYGPADFWDPLTGLDISADLRARMEFAGFLRRTVPQIGLPHINVPGDYLLITAGGGGDGLSLMEQVLAAYEHHPNLPIGALLVLGPFMPTEVRDRITHQAAGIPRIHAIEFDNHIEPLMTRAKALVSMGGYNTFCEILSFDKPALIVPRLHPRQEQLIRAERAAELGLVEMLRPEQAAVPAMLAEKLRALPGRPPPSRSGRPVSLDGLETISELVGKWLHRRAGRRLGTHELDS